MTFLSVVAAPSTMAATVTPDGKFNQSTSLQWLQAIQDATQCLRDRPREQQQQQQPQRVGIEEACHALHYLTRLEKEVLLPLEVSWDRVPPKAPPKFQPYKNRRPSNKTNTKKPRGSGGASSPNRFAMFMDNNDDDELEDEEIQVVTPTKVEERYDDTDEAGDLPTLNILDSSSSNNGNYNASKMTMRRIAIRIVTAQSELYAYQANGYRRCQSWTLGAKMCHCSLIKIHEGLLFADAEISRSFYSSQGFALRKQLMEDASIVEVAVRSLTQERDEFVHKAQQQQRKLLRKLESEYISRQSARMRMGETKWTSNPRPKNRGNKERVEQERQLQEVTDALEHLSIMDTDFLKQTTDQMKQRLQVKSSSSNKVHRHTGKRLTDIAGRVDLMDYPDPAMFGWQFTGSRCEGPNSTVHVEFFEKSGILLDWHALTGVVELSWKQFSRQGNTTFYHSPGCVDPGMYHALLKSPRPWEVVQRKMQQQYQQQQYV